VLAVRREGCGRGVQPEKGLLQGALGEWGQQGALRGEVRAGAESGADRAGGSRASAH